LKNSHKTDRAIDRGDRSKNFLALSLFCACPLYMTEVTGLTGLFLHFARIDVFIISVYTIWLNHKNTPVTSVRPVSIVFVPKTLPFLTELDFTHLCQNQFTSVSQAWSK